MTEKQTYYMQDSRKFPTRVDLTEQEAEALRVKSWLVVPVEMVHENVAGHLNVHDQHGRYIGTRMLDAVQAGDHVRQGYHLTHVAGVTQDDMKEIRVIKGLQAEAEEQ